MVPLGPVMIMKAATYPFWHGGTRQYVACVGRSWLTGSMRTCVVLDTNQWERMPMLRHELGAALLFAARDNETVFIGLPTVVKDEILVHLT